MLLAFSLVHFTWPRTSNECLLNWSGTGHRTHNMELVFVYRWGEGGVGGKKKKVMANDVSYYNLAFHPALALLLSLSSLWPGWAMGHFLEKHSTEQNDFKPTDGERSHFKDKDSPRTRALEPAHVRFEATCREYFWRVSFSKFIFLYLQLSCDGRFWHIFNCLGAGMIFFFFFKSTSAQIDCTLLTERFLLGWTLRRQWQDKTLNAEDEEPATPLKSLCKGILYIHPIVLFYISGGEKGQNQPTFRTSL